MSLCEKTGDNTDLKFWSFLGRGFVVEQVTCRGGRLLIYSWVLSNVFVSFMDRIPILRSKSLKLMLKPTTTTHCMYLSMILGF